MKPLLDQIRRKAKALNAALSDCGPNEQERPTLYFDADVVIGTFFRDADILLALKSGRASLDDDRVLQVVARSLWAGGFTSRAEMLWPHAIELKRHLEQPDEVSRPKEAYAEIMKLAERTFSKERSDTIRALLLRADVEDEGRTSDELANELRIQYFALAIAALKSWRDRFKVVGDQLDLAGVLAQAAGKQSVPASAEVLLRLCIELQLLRVKPNRRWLYQSWLRGVEIRANTYSDVCALVVLNDIAKARSVHFVSTTESFLPFLQSEVAKAHLPHLLRGNLFDHLDLEPIDRPGGVLRSVRYLHLRSVVPCLAFPDSRELVFERTSNLERQRSELAALVSTARQLLCCDIRTTALQGEANSWLTSFREIETTYALGSVWLREQSRSVKYLAQKVQVAGQFSTAVDSVSEQRAIAVEAQLRKCASIGKRMERLYRRVSAIAGSGREAGLGRWLLIATDPFGDIEGLIGRQVARLADQRPGFVGTVEDWESVYQTANEDLLSKLVAAAVLFARGRPDALFAGSDGLRVYPPERVELRIAMKLLRQCARLACRGLTGDLQTLKSETLPLESELYDARPNAAKSACIHVMDAWRTFYWCHSRTASGICSPDSDVWNSPEASAAIRQVEAWTTAHGEDPTYLPLLEGTVRVLLKSFVDAPVMDGSLAPARSGDYYFADARTWLLVQRGGLSTRQRAEIVKSFLKGWKSFEQYQVEHRAELRKLVT